MARAPTRTTDPPVSVRRHDGRPRDLPDVARASRPPTRSPCSARTWPRDLIGKVSFGHLAYQLITLREPTSSQSRVFEAVLVALADHGFTPTAIAARLTFLSAPDAIQGALAAGLLGGGSRFLGVTEDTGCVPRRGDRLALRRCRRPTRSGTPCRARRSGLAGHAGSSSLASGTTCTSRATRARRSSSASPARRARTGPHLALFEAVGRVAPEVLGKSLPLNGAGVCGAVLADLGLPLGLLRGVVLLARCAGLLGHLAEEMRSPVASAIFADVESHAVYVDPYRETTADE